MKDLRCILGLHRWKKRQVEDSQYLACVRCGKDGPTGARPPGLSGAGAG